jgi:transposase-like protein
VTYQLFDALPAHIEDALRASIERFGVLVPVVVDQNGNVIDGHHRKRIADELDVSYRVDTVSVADDDEAREVARTLNADRRQLTEDQRRDIVRLLREQGHSMRAIAGAVGVGKSTVADDVERLSGAGQLDEPSRVSRQGGGSYPSSRRPASPPSQQVSSDDTPPLPEPAPVWSAEELSMRALVEDGRVVVASLRGEHRNLIDWAEESSLYVRIDRRTEWGNPFELPADGDRATVIGNYAEHYLPFKPSLLAKLGGLKGKVLGCWCVPEACHGDVLKAAVEGDPDTYDGWAGT